MAAVVDLVRAAAPVVMARVVMVTELQVAAWAMAAMDLSVEEPAGVMEKVGCAAAKFVGAVVKAMVTEMEMAAAAAAANS